MKTLKAQLKTLMLLIVLTLFTNAYAQNRDFSKGMFVRVYNLEGKKISKGKLIFVSDTLLILKHNSKFNNLNPMDIGYIKTKRSGGHNVLIGAAIGATTVSVISIASIDPDDGYFIWDATPDNVGEALAVGVVGGGTTGAAIGGITIFFKNSKTFIINGEESNWKTFQQMTNKYIKKPLN